MLKTQVVLPEELVSQLKEAVPIRKRSQFIAQAVEARLKALKFQRALQAARGCWSTRGHRALKTQADINRYLSRFRARLGRRG